MKFDSKLRLIGFYNRPNQNMRPEESFVEEAKTLASLLCISFSSLLTNEDTDSFFKEILTGNTVFILKNEDDWLFAYYPKKQIARISNVVFNKRNINSIPLKYKSWFIPGYPIDVSSMSQYKITTKGRDFIISYNGKELPLEWNGGYISIRDLYKLLECKFTELSEFNTKDNCIGCDGYDYDYCDRDRCREECEGCGGRRYKCTKEKCFNKRYDNAFSITLNREEVDSFQAPIKDLLEILCSPHFQYTDLVLSENRQLIDDFVKTRNFLWTYGWDFDVWEMYIRFKKLQKFREYVHKTDLVLVVVENSSYKVCTENLRVEESGLFFIDYYLQTIDTEILENEDGNASVEGGEYGETYDSISDSFIKFNFPLCFDSKEQRKMFMNYMANKKVSKICLVKNKKNEYLVESFGR